MDTAEPDGRRRSFEQQLPQEVVRALAEHGHLDLLRREAEAGDYECADALGRLLRARGEPSEAALRLLRPFLDTDWVARAVDHIAEILVEDGDVGPAMELLRPLADEGQLEAVERFGALLVGLGRDDELLAMLRRGLADHLHPIDVVVELTRDLGRDDEVIGLLRSPVAAGAGVDSLLASVLERAGRPAEAVAVLWACIRGGPYAVQDAEQLADVLARHDPEALADLAAGHRRAFAARRYARWCEERGRVDDAVAVLAGLAARQQRKREREQRREHGLVPYRMATWYGPVTEAALNRNAAWLHADLLARHGRVQEAITVLRSAAAADPALVRPLCVLLIGQDRPDEARAVAAGIAAAGWPDPVLVRLEWIEALVAGGRHEQAIAELRTDPDADGGYARERLAALLAEAGPPDEAIAMLGPAAEGHNRILLATALIRAGRPDEAIAALHAVPATHWV
ncbi:hypothetical protein Daura_36945 [Dactylosporangium aurantiacum]|uniref:Tetratricopeptide repeat protein n=1 Tax=Dactylosporangium aurantiacum TaxID=35754 RepID=A0A9Q9ID73_9ACTN|nr:hypothetical protein [Dactylosporangium aurantiacum]MDG6108927.1 hypothetical protein [Dactylosporangium aurantiacum]UWZ52220.1 hypothetical protein Daura_36945 [Dactylosporangium aurantiacum]